MAVPGNEVQCQEMFYSVLDKPWKDKSRVQCNIRLFVPIREISTDFLLGQEVMGSFFNREKQKHIKHGRVRTSDSVFISA